MTDEIMVLLNRYGLFDRAIKSITKYETDGSSFSAVTMAEQALAGTMTIGQMARNEPRGLAPADKYKYIAKWYNIEKEDRKLVHGVMLSEDFRDGDVYVVMFDMEA